MNEYIAVQIYADENFTETLQSILDEKASREWIFDQMIALPNGDICIVFHRNLRESDKASFED